MGVLLFIIALSVLIVVHEAGHYLAARWAGVHVEVFSLGYGKRLFGIKIGKTDFRVSMFPLGGYAKMYGDITEEVASDMIKGGKKKPEIEVETTKAETEIPEDRSFFRKSRFKRFVILAAGSVFNIFLAIILIWITNIAGREVPVYKSQVPVLGGVVEDSPAAKAGLMAGDRIIAINGETMKNWEETEIKVMINPKQLLNIDIERNGETKSLKVQPVEVGKNKTGYIGLISNNPLLVDRVLPGSEAERIGMKSGDIIKQIDDIEVNNFATGIMKIANSPDREITLVLERDGKNITVKGMTKGEKDPETGKMIGKLGFAPTIPTTIRKWGVIDGFTQSIKENIRFGKLFFVSISKLFSNQLSIRTMSGPIEITSFTVAVAEEGILPLIFLVGYISLNLGLVNLAPIPLLDGGALMILLLEGIRRKDFSITTKERILQVGFFLIVALFLVIIYNDLAKMLF